MKYRPTLYKLKQVLVLDNDVSLCLYEKSLRRVGGGEDGGVCILSY